MSRCRRSHHIHRSRHTLATVLHRFKMAFRAIKYKKVPLPDDTNEYDSRFARLARSRTWTNLILAFFSSLLAISLFAGFRHVSNSSIQSCGSSVPEAIARGCKFELLNFAWLPPDCYDEEISREWDEQSWGFWRDEDGKEQIPQAIALKGESEYAWVTFGQHLTHCTYMLRKYQRAKDAGKPLDPWTGSYNHTVHCSKILLNRVIPLERINSKLERKFLSCV